MDYELTPEQRELRAVVHDFVATELRPRARHTDETGEFNWPAVRKMGPLGLLGLGWVTLRDCVREGPAGAEKILDGPPSAP